MTDLQALTHKENNPLNTAAKNYGKQYVLTAKEWIKVIKAIQENQNSIKEVKYNGTSLKPDDSGAVEIETVSLQDLVTFIENSGYITKEDLPEMPDLSKYALITQIPKDNSELTNGAGYLTEHQSLQGLATKEELDNAILKKESDVVNYIKEGYQPKGNYLTAEKDLIEYAKKSELPIIPTLVSTFDNDAHYITRSDLDNVYELMQKLDNVLNPLTVTMEKIPSDNKVIFSNQDSYRLTIAGDVQRGGIRVEPDTATLKLNGEVIEDFEITPFDYTIDKPQLGTYTFTYGATLGSQKAETTTSVQFVLPFYYGCSRSPVALDLILNDLEVISPVALNSVTTLNLYDGYYLWLCLPSDMKITRCKCNDFDFPLLAPVQIVDQMGTYNCYRSANELGLEAGEITLNITY